MKFMRNLKTAFATFAALVLLPAFLQAQDRASNAAGDVQIELVGQVTNATSTTSIQYGYLTYINGISGVANIFNPGPKSESTALFTFFNDTVNESVITNGTIRIINRVGQAPVHFKAGRRFKLQC
jgi:hypothetical protein